MSAVAARASPAGGQQDFQELSIPSDAVLPRKPACTVLLFAATANPFPTVPEIGGFRLQPA